MHETLPFAGCCIYLKRREKHRKPINNLNNLIMEWIINQLRERPELAIFLTLFLGFWLGKLRIGKFSLGTVTSVLLVGVLVGQLKIDVPGPIKSVFFLLFLFAVGYKVGPQFFRGLKKDGLPQVGFAVLMCVSVLVVTWLLALVMYIAYLRADLPKATS